MECCGYELTCGEPFTGQNAREIRTLLTRAGLSYDENIRYTAALWDSDGRAVATGSLDGNVIKCVATAPEAQGEGLCAGVISQLVARGAALGHHHLFLFTKPKNLEMFADLGFYPVGETDSALLMENRRNGVKNFVAGLESPKVSGQVGVIVANCNPFTNGHLFLAQQAAKECELVHFFLLSEDRSTFPADIRLQLAREGLADCKNILVHPTGGYLVSAATFPDYFLKDRVQADQAAGELDLQIFCRHFAQQLHITRRYVGEEPFCPVTRSYNARMKSLLPAHGVQVIEIPRFAAGDREVSASHVRKLLAEGRMAELTCLVPESTYRYLCSEQGQQLARRLAEDMTAVEKQ